MELEKSYLKNQTNQNMSAIFGGGLTPKKGLRSAKKKWPSTPKGSLWPSTPNKSSLWPTTPSKSSVTKQNAGGCSIPRAPQTPSQETSVTSGSIESRELFPPTTPSEVIYVPSAAMSTPKRRPHLVVETCPNDFSTSNSSFNDGPISTSAARDIRDSDFTPRQRSNFLKSPPPVSIVDDFIPQQRSSPSRRSQNKVTGDKDTWIEIQVIMTRRNEKRKRSLFYSVKTQTGVWDEPPSGASNIILRNEMKCMADQFALAGRIN